MVPRRVVPALAFALAAAVLGPVAPAGAAPGLIYDNGGLNPTASSSSGVAAPSGSFYSELQHEGGYSNGAFGFSLGDGVRIADDFTVPAGQRWTLDALQTYVVRSVGSPAVTTGTLRIWSGRPGDPGSVPVFGDTTTDRLIDSISVKTYRIGDTTAEPSPSAPTTTSPIYQNTYEVSPTLALGPGTYWIDWSAVVFGLAPTVTVPGRRTLPGWNGRRFADDAWSSTVDTGLAPGAPRAPQDFPFVLVGTVVPTQPATTPTAPAAPDTALGRTPKKKTTKKKAVFTLTSTIAGSGFECSVNDAAYAPCGATTKVKAKKGKNTFSARAVAGGVVDLTPATYSWKLKKKRPR